MRVLKTMGLGALFLFVALSLYTLQEGIDFLYACKEFSPWLVLSLIAGYFIREAEEG